jgi:hypothetical protein
MVETQSPEKERSRCQDLLGYGEKGRDGRALVSSAIKEIKGTLKERESVTPGKHLFQVQGHRRQGEKTS